MAISGMPVIGRHTKLGHGHLLNEWKAPEGQDTVEISHDSGFRTESPVKPSRISSLRVPTTLRHQLIVEHSLSNCPDSFKRVFWIFCVF